MIRRPPRSTLFPYRRSSDLFLSGTRRADGVFLWSFYRGQDAGLCLRSLFAYAEGMSRDRKSTRLNSSHTVISYAVFCLKKKTRRHFVLQVGQQAIQHTTTPY